MKTRLFSILFGLCCLLNSYAQTAQEETVTIAILSLNDFHGGFVRNEKKELPGAGNLLFVIDSLKQVYPYHVVVAAGDNFGGSYFSNVTNGTLMPQLFNEAGIKTSAVGNHEFDNGQQFLADKWKDDPNRPEGWDLTYVCANVKEEKTDIIPAWTVPMEKYTVNVSQGEPVTVNFVGLIAESAPKQTAKKNVEGLVFDGDYNAVLDGLKMAEHPLYRINTSDVNILLTHIGTEMDQASVITWTEGEENPKQQIQKNSLYHGILSAHSHKYVCGLKDNMPIVQGEISGKYIGLLEVKYSVHNKGVVSVTPKLVPVFKKNWELSSMDSIVKKTVSEKGLDVVIGNAKESLIHSRYDSQKFTALGSYVCMAFADKYRAVAGKKMTEPVLSFFGFGSVRTDLLEGEVTKIDAGEVLPFAEDLVAYKVKGKDIKNFIEHGINDKTHGWLQMNNLRVDYVEEPESLRVVNVHYRVPGQIDIVLNDQDEYVVVSVDFLLGGGDGYPNLKEVSEQIQIDLKGSTDSFFEFLGSWKDNLHEDNSYKAKAEKVN